MTAGSKQNAVSIFDIHLRIGIVALALAVMLATTLIAAPAAQAQTFSVIHTSTDAGDGGEPYAGLSMDRAGSFYGTTNTGAGGGGTVFRLKRAGSGWVLTTLYAFQNDGGGRPTGGVIVGPDGSVYGMTQYGGTGCSPNGCGTVYMLRPPAAVCKAVSCPWTKTILYSFQGYPDGGYPEFGSLTLDKYGNLYGATAGEGANLMGTVFRMTPSNGGWTESVLYNFTGGADGALPYSTVTIDGAGNLYGTTFAGGDAGGSVYELSPSGSGWTEKTLYTFTGGSDGYQLVGGVAIDQQGNLYGGTEKGGVPAEGTAFELTPSGGGWTYTLLQSFSGYDGPFSTPTLDAAGNVYLTSIFSTLDGSSQAGGVYKLTRSHGGWSTSALYTFTGGNDGNIPAGSVILDGNGNIYGTTVAGGSYNQGVIFEIKP